MYGLHAQGGRPARHVYAKLRLRPSLTFSMPLALPVEMQKKYCMARMHRALRRASHQD